MLKNCLGACTILTHSANCPTALHSLDAASFRANWASADGLSAYLQSSPQTPLPSHKQQRRTGAAAPPCQSAECQQQPEKLVMQNCLLQGREQGQR